MSTAEQQDVQKELESLYHEMNRISERMKELKKKSGRGSAGAYTLTGPGGAEVTLADAFGDKPDLIVIHNMGKSCPYCTLWADGFKGLLPHLEDRAAVVLVSPDSPEVQAEFAASRDWKFRMLSSAGTTFKEDYGFASEEGQQMPGYSTFHRAEDGTITNVANDYFGPGDSYCGVWHMLDLLADGASGWQPKFTY